MSDTPGTPPSSPTAECEQTNPSEVPSGTPTPSLGGCPKEKKPRPTLPLKIHRQIERLEKRIEKLTQENTSLKEKLKMERKAHTRIRKLP